MTAEQREPALDAEGRPILLEVVVPGDEARARGLILPVQDEAAPAGASTLQPQKSAQSLERYLQERIEQAVRRALPEATRRSVERLRRQSDHEPGDEDRD